MTEITRRNAIATAVAATAAASAALSGCKKDAPRGAPAEGAMKLPDAGKTSAEMPTRVLGKTGVVVSRIGLGGAHIGKQKEESESIRIIRTAVDRGVTFLDNCWDYNDGKSEDRMGKALADGYRQKSFLMTKLDGRTKASALAQLEQSLKRLRTDVIDLVQIHEVIRASDPEACFQPGGCIEALVEAKKAGKLRFIGFTGHKDPKIHLAMLAAADKAGFSFDTVQMPMNVMDAHYRSFEKEVLPVLLQKNIGVLSMKAIGSGDILQSKTVTAVECLQYALNLPSSVLITGCDSIGVLEQAISTVLAFQPLDAAAVAALLAKTREAAAQGDYEKFKTAEKYDGTTKNPKWLATAEL